jgi:hypothetical protein
LLTIVFRENNIIIAFTDIRHTLPILLSRFTRKTGNAQHCAGNNPYIINIHEVFMAVKRNFSFFSFFMCDFRPCRQGFCPRRVIRAHFPRVWLKPPRSLRMEFCAERKTPEANPRNRFAASS